MGFETGVWDPWRQGRVADEVAITGADSFNSPWEGSMMARLGGTAASDNETQPEGPNQICQDFVVDQAQERFAFNIFTYDYTGFDEFEFRVRVVDPTTGDILGSYIQEAWGSGTSLKTSGWRGVVIDLAGHIGQTVRITFTAGGTSDDLYGFWAYLDSADLSLPPELVQSATVTSATGSVMTDPITGQITVGMPTGSKSDITLSMNPECSTNDESGVTLLLDGTAFTMTGTPGGSWTATIPAGSVAEGTLTISYACGGKTFTVPVGSIQLYDPSGNITDAVTSNPIQGAEVLLFNVPGWTAETASDSDPTTCESNATKGTDGWNATPVPSDSSSYELANIYADPAIMDPEVNPFVTNAEGRYGWDVAAGCWFIEVSKTGYVTKRSTVVGVPTEVTDLHLALQPVAGPTPPPPTPTSPVSKGLALTAQPKKVAKGKKTNLTALVTPCAGNEGAFVNLFRGSNQIASLPVGDACTAQMKVRMKKTATFQAESPAQDANHQSAKSNTVKVKVKKKKSPRPGGASGSAGAA
jgi:hypothetical protein